LFDQHYCGTGQSYSAYPALKSIEPLDKLYANFQSNE